MELANDPNWPRDFFVGINWEAEITGNILVKISQVKPVIYGHCFGQLPTLYIISTL